MEQSKENLQTKSGYDPWQVEYEEENDPLSIGKLMEEKSGASLHSVNKKHSRHKTARKELKNFSALALFKGNSMNLGNISFHSEYPRALIKEMIEMIQRYEKTLRNKDLKIQNLESLLDSSYDLADMWPE